MDRIRIRYLIISLILFSGFVLFANYSLHFNGFMWSDSQDYNQMARNILEGKGFSTSVFRPIDFLAFKSLPHAEITRPPLYPYLIAVFYKLFGINDLAVVLVDCIFYVLFVVMMFAFSLEFSESRGTALTATACTALAPWFLKMSLIGSTDIVFAALFMLFLFAFVRQKENPFLMGLLTGLLYLTRWNAIFVGLALVSVEYNPLLKRENRRRFILFCAGGLLMASPVLLRNLLFQGAAVSAINSSGLFSGGQTFPGYFYISQIEPYSAWEFIKTHPGEFAGILYGRFVTILKDFPDDYGIVLLAMMIAGLFVPLKHDMRKRIRRLIIVIAVIQTVGLVMSSAEARYYGFLVPAAVTCLFTFFRNIEDIRIEKAIYYSGVAAVLLFSLKFWIDEKPNNYYKILAADVKNETAKDDIVISDLAWGISWYGDRKTVWLTYDLPTLDRISDILPIKYALISFKTIKNPLVPYKDRFWEKLFFNPGSYTIRGFTPIKVYYTNKQPIGILYKVERK